MPETRGYSLEAIQDGFRRPPMSKVLTRLASRFVGRGATAQGGDIGVDSQVSGGDELTMSGAIQESEGSTALPGEFEMGSITQRIEVGTA